MLRCAERIGLHYVLKLSDLAVVAGLLNGQELFIRIGLTVEHYGGSQLPLSVLRFGGRLHDLFCDPDRGEGEF